MFDGKLLLVVRFYKPWWVLACSRISFHLNLFMSIHLRFLIFTLHMSCITSSSNYIFVFFLICRVLVSMACSFSLLCLPELFLYALIKRALALAYVTLHFFALSDSSSLNLFLCSYVLLVELWALKLEGKQN
jgi:hypothetical protein